MLISGELSDVKQKHHDTAKEFGAMLYNVYYDTDIIREHINASGDFEKYIRETKLTRIHDIRYLYMLGLI
jgi:hypothetical protein